MTIDPDELKLVPENFLHTLALHVLRLNVKRMRRKLAQLDVVLKANPRKSPQCYQAKSLRERIQDLEESVEALEKDRTVRQRRARIRVVP